MYIKLLGPKFRIIRAKHRFQEALVPLNKYNSSRRYSLCCPPPRDPRCGYPPPTPIVPPATCRPTRIPVNPCCPEFHHGKNTWKKYKYIALFIGLPVIILQTIRVSGQETPPKGECREYEYMMIRTKKYPWGDGNATLFHNDHVNHLPGDCQPPGPDCD